MKIVADNTVPYLKGVLEPIADMVYLPSSEFTAEQVREADALIVRSIDKCTRELLSGSRVRLITTATIGFDHIDTRFCAEAGITWQNAPGCNAASVGQYVTACLLTLASQTGESLAGKTIGIVGVGHVGQIVAHHCQVLGMRVLLNDPPRAEKEGAEGFVSLQQIAEEADVVTLHVPLTREGTHATYHLADSRFFQALQRRPWFINSCRGAVHDTAALLEAWRAGRVSRLAIDCWEQEPTISTELLEAASIATPHIAGFSADGKANGTRMCLEAISRFFDVEIERIGQVVPPAPLQAEIDLNQWQTRRVEQAILATFNPLEIDKKLRFHREKFEYFRAHYDHPREYPAYRIVGATPEESSVLARLGFCLPE
ncbi:MAG: 4-phosphoerythronate dehydrogenase PdxB [Parabacteroides sp.]